jgi:hypothetical protein
VPTPHRPRPSSYGESIRKWPGATPMGAMSFATCWLLVALGDCGWSCWTSAAMRGAPRAQVQPAAPLAAAGGTAPGRGRERVPGPGGVVCAVSRSGRCPPKAPSQAHREGAEPYLKSAWRLHARVRALEPSDPRIARSSED